MKFGVCGSVFKCVIYDCLYSVVSGVGWMYC